MADSLRSNAVPPFAPSYLQAFKASSSATPYRLDEGYSEDTESRADSRMGDNDPPPSHSLLPDYFLNMSEMERQGWWLP